VRILTILGTRPEIIRLSLIIERLDPLCDHILVHTGQNYDERLSDVFFHELGVRAPDRYLGVRGASAGEQIAAIIAASEKALLDVNPDRLLVLGDTNSALSAFVAKRLGIPVYHLEAGNRCFDDRVPEEVNRRVIDHSSDVLLPYTNRSRDNLLREGIASHRIYVVGNPIAEVLARHDDSVRTSRVHEELGLEPGGYFLVTMHRQENVDLEPRLRSLVEAMSRLAATYELPVVCSLHPRTARRLQEFGVAPDDPAVRLVPPFGLFDFIAMERSARCVLSDSGTVQEECAILGVPNVTIRDTTERPETLECGSNMLSGISPEVILRCVETVLSDRSRWLPPPEYLRENVSATVARIVLGHGPTAAGDLSPNG
jgi:UDP-N-acetylglucosamine 2-epimerase (non-hydrolysing)